MRLTVVLLMTMTLVGCVPNRAQDLAACQREASRFYMLYRATDPDKPSGRYIIGCMAAKGYEFTIAPNACDNRHPFPTQAACYAPTNWLASLIDRIYPQ